MRERQTTLPPKLRKVAATINEAIMEAKKIEELAVQEEVIAELDKVTSSLELAKKEIVRIMKLSAH